MRDEVREKIRKYFKKFPGWTVTLLIFGIIALIAGGAISGGQSYDIREIQESGVPVIAFMAGGFFVLISIIGIIAYYSGMPGDNEIDEQLGKDLKNFPNIALKKLGLDESQIVGNYIYLWSPLWDDIERINAGETFREFRFKQGKDGRFRFSRYKIMILIPTEEHLGVFTVTYDFINNTFYNQMTGEYFYKDIVSIRTERERDLSITFTDGRSFDISIPSDKHARKIYECLDVPFVPFDDAVQVIRKMVQAHKQV